MLGAMPSTLRDLVADRARTLGGAPALLAPGRDAWSYARLGRGIERAGAALARLGLAGGSRVAILLPNGRDAAAAILATASWTPCAPLDPRIDATQAARLFASMRIAALIVDAEGREGAVATAARHAGVSLVEFQPAADDEDELFRLAARDARSPSAQRPPTRDDVALLVHTSGTTAAPRIVPITHTALLAVGARSTVRADDRCLCMSPLHTNSGFGVGVMVPLKASASSVIVPGYEEAAFFAWLEAFRPTYYSASPTVHAAIADAIVRRGARLPASVRFVRSSSAGLTAALQARLESTLGVPVIQGYGSSEAGLIAQDEPGVRRAGSVGRAADIEIRIVDDAGRELPRGTPGEIVVRGPAVMRGYENDEEANRDAFRDGWYRTGDIGSLDDDGYLTVTGRIREMINRGGLKVAPAEVDALLLGHPAVQDAAAVGIAHRTLGEDVVAAVILRPGATADADELRQFALARLAPHKVPSRIVFVDAFPRGALGKVQRAVLAESIAQRLHASMLAPRDTDEALIAGIFAAVLNLPSVGALDHFFELGGDSLSGAQIVARITAATGVPLKPAALFQAPTVEQLARVLAAARQSPVPGTAAEPALVRREHRRVAATALPRGPDDATDAS